MTRERIRQIIIEVVADNSKLTSAIYEIENALAPKIMEPVDEFAKHALQAYMVNCDAIKVNDGYIADAEYKNLAAYSYEIADAMYEEKKKRSVNLCATCKFHPATCVSEHVFGLGLGKDNVFKCDKFSENTGGMAGNCT